MGEDMIGGWGGGEREGAREKRMLLSTGLIPKSLQWPRLGWAEAKSQKLRAGLPCGWQDTVT